VTSAPAPAAPSALSLEAAVRRGLRGDAARLAREALAEESEMRLVEERLIPALDQVGADYEQGYHFSRPLPPDQFMRYLETQAF
jgi:5-methyltetrahydrofolate--homocysteine methyltransferase